MNENERGAQSIRLSRSEDKISPWHCGAVGHKEEPVSPVKNPQGAKDAHRARHSYQKGQVDPEN